MRGEGSNQTVFSGGGRVAALIGPTASGKTALSLCLAEILAARSLKVEIISVDSRQVYRYMDVGTDKLPRERRSVPHHMIDVADPDESFSVADFVDGAVAAANRIIARGRVPLFVGGTPFYCHALFHASMNASLPHDSTVRRRYEELAASDGPDALHARLQAVDPPSAARLHPNDIRRVSRALELWELTGKPPSVLYERGEKLNFGFNVLYIGVSRPRPELFERIRKRLEEEFSSGFPEEVVWLLDNGFDERFPPMQGLGYRELAAWRRGKIALEQALEESVTRTRAFCRRQMTWFGKFEPVLWLNSPESAAEAILRHLEGDNPSLEDKAS